MIFSLITARRLLRCINLVSLFFIILIMINRELNNFLYIHFFLFNSAVFAKYLCSIEREAHTGKDPGQTFNKRD